MYLTHVHDFFLDMCVHTDNASYQNNHQVSSLYNEATIFYISKCTFVVKGDWRGPEA